MADTLESEWNNGLRSLAAVRQEYDRDHQSQEEIITEKNHKRLLALTADFKHVWNDSGTSSRERKRMLAYIIDDVTLMKVPKHLNIFEEKKK